MYDIRQFKPVIYVVTMIGILGFAMAAETPAVFFLGAVALVVNAVLVFRGVFTPIPHFASNLITIAGLIFVANEVMTEANAPVIVIGEFLLLLQMVKLWEQRNNRDFGVVLMLSLLLMVAAAISTASIFFGLLLIVYLLLALYCCLLYNLKVESDRAKEAIAPLRHDVSPAVLRQDQRKLARSMRMLTGVIASTSIAFAIVVFVIFPRGAGEGMLGPMQFRPTQTLTGFTDEVSFQTIARIQQNEELVAKVRLKHLGQNVEGTTPMLLRGVTLDTYTGKKGGWRWLRWPRTAAKDPADMGRDSQLEPVEVNPDMRGEASQMAPGIPYNMSPFGRTPSNESWVQEITLLPTGTNVLFAMAGAYSITPARIMDLHYSLRDGEMRNYAMHDRDRPPRETVYEVTSSNSLGSIAPPVESGTVQANIDPMIRAYLRDPAHAIVGSDPGGPLVEQRLLRPHFNGEPDILDEQIARSIEAYLKHGKRNAEDKEGFEYTLDLTDTKQLEGRDPLVNFLYDTHRGHCQVYAAAMTLMCQSIGMKARMCLGFRSTEYNHTGKYYMIRSSHAHAWVEVYTASGWQTFDPTSDSDTREQQRHEGFWQKIKHVVDALQFAYGNSIITYGNDHQTNLWASTESAIGQSAAIRSARRSLFSWLNADHAMNTRRYWDVSTLLLTAAMGVLGALAAGIVGWFAWEKWKLWRTARRIGIGGLPQEERLRLARQLEFYDQLLKLLGRHGVIRQPHQTPREFSRSLLYLPSRIYDQVSRLTEIYYRIRYGRTELSAARKANLIHVIQSIDQDLRQSPRRGWAPG